MPGPPPHGLDSLFEVGTRTRLFYGHFGVLCSRVVHFHNGLNEAVKTEEEAQINFQTEFPSRVYINFNKNH